MAALAVGIAIALSGPVGWIALGACAVAAVAITIQSVTSHACNGCLEGAEWDNSHKRVSWGAQNAILYNYSQLECSNGGLLIASETFDEANSISNQPELGIRNVCKKLVISLYFCNFIVENQSITTNITMITKDKITEIFCIADDFCKEFELETDKIGLSERNKGCHRHRRWRMSKSEIITILICFHFNSYRNFRHYYTFFVKEHLADLFPNQLSYNRFLELEARVSVEMMMFLQICCFGRCTGISFIDSTCIPVCHNKRICRNKVFRNYATRGKSTMGWYFGFKLHLICNERGEILNFMLTKANVDDRDENVFNRLTDNVFGKLFADKGYISQGLFERLFNDGINLVTGVRSNMKNKLMPLYDRILLRKRSVIETINDELKNVAQLVHSRHRSIFNFAMNVLSAIAAYCFFEKKPAVNIDFAIEQHSGQLTLF